MEKKRRFASTTDEEFEQKRLKMNAQKPLNRILLGQLYYVSITIDKRAVTKRCRRTFTEGQWAVVNFV
jgi:hypothetical protein